MATLHRAKATAEAAKVELLVEELLLRTIVTKI
jgi:hypothetical protein